MRRAVFIVIASCSVIAAGHLVIDEDFSHGMNNWWVEGGERVWVEDGRLHVKADNPHVPGGAVATVWCKTLHPADFELELDAHVVSSSAGVNNINLFFNYADPNGTPLYDTRGSRRDASYDRYHKLNGYIVTFLHADRPAARVRIRRDPGFQLLAETYAGECNAGVTYHLRAVKRHGDIRFLVDGKELLSAHDPRPLGPGYLGLRTYRTYLWWDNVKLRSGVGLPARTGPPGPGTEPHPLN